MLLRTNHANSDGVRKRGEVSNLARSKGARRKMSPLRLDSGFPECRGCCGRFVPIMVRSVAAGRPACRYTATDSEQPDRSAGSDSPSGDNGLNYCDLRHCPAFPLGHRIEIDPGMPAPGAARPHPGAELSREVRNAAANVSTADGCSFSAYRSRL
jgi:hypothetical protein